MKNSQGSVLGENPYFHRGPIKEKEYFYNRERETKRILGLLRNGQSVSIVGPRRIGKTSLLFFISQPSIMSQANLDPNHHIMIYLDGQELQNLDQKAICQRIVEEIQEHSVPVINKETDQVFNPRKRSSPSRQVEQLLKTMSAYGLRLYLLLDEFELFSNNPHLDASFFSWLRGLAAKNLAFVTASQNELYHLTYAHTTALSSPFFNIFFQFSLGLFSKSAARKFIIEPSANAGLHFCNETVDFILRAAGRHPFFLQIASYCVFERQTDQKELDKDDYVSLEEEVASHLEGHFRYYWDNQGLPERDLLANLEKDIESQNDKDSLKRLEQDCLIIKRKDEKYHYFSDLFRKFVQNQTNSKYKPGYSFTGDLTGKDLGGRYQIMERLGAGSLGIVYKAYQPSLNRYVAVKILPPFYAYKGGFQERFQREARVVARLEHPHILPVHDFGQDGDLTYIVMQYVQGGTLKEKLEHSLNQDTAIDIASQIGSALAHAHRRDVIHRDVKPSNILMTANNWVLLADFGLARIAGSSGQMSGSGITGTPDYISPEQVEGAAGDARSDIYALGIVLYEMLTGRVPFKAEQPASALVQRLLHPAPAPRHFNSNIPQKVEQVVLKALARDPLDRYQVIEEMLEALQTISSGF